MRIRAITSAALSAILLTACEKKEEPNVAQQGAASASDLAAVRQAIETGNAGLIAAVQRGDSAGAASFYDPEGMTMPPEMNASVGRANIEKMFAGLVSQMTVKDMKLQIQDVVASGNLAVETGHYEWTLVPKKGKAATEKGKYVVAWRKQSDGSWKLFRDIFNNDAPEAKPATK